MTRDYREIRKDERFDYFVGRTPVKNKIEKLELHLEEFKGSALPWVEDFKEWVMDAPNHTDSFELELSNKLDVEENNPGRFNIWYDFDCRKEVLDKLFETILKRASTDNDIKTFFLNEIEHPNVKLFSGMDLRNNPKDSRLKLWLIYNNLPNHLPKFLNWFDSNPLINRFSSPDYFIIGYNFYEKLPPDKKIYFAYPEENRKNNEFLLNAKTFLSEKTQILLNMSDEVFFSFDKNKELVLFFVPKLPYEFAHILGSQNLFQMIKRYYQMGFPLKIVGIKERDIITGNVERLNTYYGF